MPTDQDYVCNDLEYVFKNLRNENFYATLVDKSYTIRYEKNTFMITMNNPSVVTSLSYILRWLIHMH